MTVMSVIALVATTLLMLPLGYPAYRIGTAKIRGEQASGRRRVLQAIWDLIWLIALLTTAVAAANVFVTRVVGTPSTEWRAVLHYFLYTTAIAVAMAALDWPASLLARRRRPAFFAFVMIANISMFCFLLMNQFLLTSIYMDDQGLRSSRVRADSNIGSPAGPHVGFASHLGYYMLRPVRGAVVIVRGEGSAKVPATWQRVVPARFHWADEKNRVQLYVGRVIGMPGETVELLQGRAKIGGRLLDEWYVQNEMTMSDGLTISLGARDYLLGEDVRRDHTASANPFYVVHESQVLSRQFLIVWPPQSFGLVQPPRYNVDNPGLWNVRVGDQWLWRFAKM